MAGAMLGFGTADACEQRKQLGCLGYIWDYRVILPYTTQS